MPRSDNVEDGAWRYVKEVVNEKKLTFFKELTPRSRTYELRGQGKKKEMYKIKTNKQLTLSHKKIISRNVKHPLSETLN